MSNSARRAVAAFCDWVVRLVGFAPTKKAVVGDAPGPVQDPRPWQERVEEIERNRTQVQLDGQPAAQPPSMRPPMVDGAAPFVDNALHEYLQLLIDAEAWDAARTALQKVAYTMPDASLDEKLAFAGYVKDFAELDPIFRKVLSVVIPAVAAKPGLKQTEVYELMPDLDKEVMRYVLYYAHVLALIERKKKGSAYQLFPFVEGVSERWDEQLSRKLAAADREQPSHRQIRAEMWAHRLPQLRAAVERRPYWQFRAVGDQRDPPACMALNGRVERHDSTFWDNHAPWNCRRHECRCTVRPYSRGELLDKGVEFPD